MRVALDQSKLRRNQYGFSSIDCLLTLDWTPQRLCEAESAHFHLKVVWVQIGSGKDALNDLEGVCLRVVPNLFPIVGNPARESHYHRGANAAANQLLR